MSGRAARADRNDLRLINLCDASTGACPWITKTATTTVVNINTGDPDAAARFRSLMSELGVVAAPRLQTPADTLGFAGFQVSAELGVTEISNHHKFWNGIEAVPAANPNAARPAAALTTVGGFLRKGMVSPVPSIELGVGAVNILQSSMWSLQGYVRVAVQEGFHDYPLPSLALRAAFSKLVGTSEASMNVTSLDVLISKAFSMAGTARIEPYVGWDLLLVDAQSGVIDATPECDAAAVLATNRSDANAVARLPRSCQAQAGTSADYGANFRFPHQDLIVRNRWFGGAKLKLYKFFLVAELAFAPAGGSADGSAATNRARDRSGTQRSGSLSAGLDF
jgi:hypothetical protein